MKQLRIFLAAILCVSLLAFTGCGGNNAAEDNADNGTVTEENADMNDGAGTDNETGGNGDNGSNRDDSVVDDMAQDAKDAADDVENAVDGNDRADSTKETRTNQ